MALRYRPWMGHTLGVVVASGAAAGMCIGATRYAHANLLMPKSLPKVVLIEAPQWMSQTLQQQIISAVTPPFPTLADDASAVRDVAGKLLAYPWVKSVEQVRRGFDESPGDVIEVRATFRTPVALVRDGEWYWMVDSSGVKLPEKFAVNEVPTVVVSRDRKLNFRIITGVFASAPAAGSVWAGEDVRAGLDLAALLETKSFADDIVMVDVSNFMGRQEPNLPQLVLKTRYDTQIGWGRPVNARDWFVEISNQDKLKRLELFKNRFGRVDANRDYIDIRMETAMAKPARAK